MKLARLELFGFKSFLNRTVLQFGEGITSVVGPNGCGKSNIVDAIVWALGERGTKSLRVKEMGDVIFHGSNGKRPVNIAEVSVTFSGVERDFAVKRRIYRDGVNEYFMNGAPVRLKDIQDLFLGTGVGLNAYAIVEQGKIDSFVLMKPLERRVVIEEASGVTRFEEKKRDAIIRMEEVTANLERIEDIRSEVKKSFEKAETEWNRWKAYKELAEKLSEIEKEILVRGYSDLIKKIGKIQEKHDGMDEEIRRREEERGALGEELQAKEAEFSLTDSVIRKLEIDIKAQEKDMENRLLEVAYVREEEKRLEEECATLAKNIMALEEECEKNRAHITTLEKERGEHVGSLEEDTRETDRLKEDIAGSRTGIEAYEKQIEEERVQFFVSMSALTDIKNRISEMERLNQEREKKEERRLSEKIKSEERLAELERQRASLKARLEQTKQEKALLTSKETEAHRRKEELTRATEEMKRVLETLKGEHRIREKFLSQMTPRKSATAENLAGIKRLMDLVRIEADKEQVVERFFAKEMEYYVLSEVAPEGISEMVKRYAGNYVFFPEKGMFRLKGQEIEVDVTWVDHIEEAFARIGKGEEGIFMNNEALVDSRGYVLTGKDTGTSQLKELREKKRIEKELQGIETSIKEQVDALADLELQREATEKTHQHLRKDLDEKEKFLGPTERQILIVEAELRSVKDRLKEIESGADFVEETSVAVVEDLLSEKELREKDKETREQTMASLRNALERVKGVYEETLSKWHEMTICVERKSNLLKRLDEDRARTETLMETRTREIKAIQERTGQKKQRIEECSRKVQGLERNYEHIEHSSKKNIERYEGLKEVFGRLHMEKQGLSSHMEGIQRDIDRRKNKKESLETETALFLEKKETICERLRAVYGIDHPESIPLSQGVDLDAAREELAKAVSLMGEVNFRAEKEYLEIQERLVFLETQISDLEAAMASLKKTIAKIDSLSKEMFSETLGTVNDTFRRFAETLFKGGQGYLGLDKDSGGVEIYVQPPGKKVLRMEQLSGGEKALISLAFLLSLMDTKPSPFSLLDEIDAPLDDANLLSLMEIIKDIRLKTQIIFITHNRITMEASDVVYGITMEEEGISKVVSVRL